MITAREAIAISCEARELIIIDYISDAAKLGENHVTISDYPMTEPIRQKLIDSGFIVKHSVVRASRREHRAEHIMVDDPPEYDELGVACGEWTICWH